MHKTVRSLFVLLIIVGNTLMVGCGSSVPVIKPFKMDIQQGNVVTSKMLLQLRPGMTKSQVKFIMGTPLVNDSFHTNRWDYFYQMRRAGKVIEQRRVILDFEKELLARVRGNVVPQGTPGAETGVSLSKEPSATTKPVAKEGLLENLKFWKSNQESVVEPAAKPADVKPKAADTKPIAIQPPAKDETIAVPMIEAPAAEAEAPSMLAVPIEIAPLESAPVPVIPPSPIAPAIVEPVKEPAIIVPPAPTKPATVKPEPVKPAPAPVKDDDKLIFRLDKGLNADNLQNAEKAPAEANAKPKDEEQNTVPAEDPGYFERMLEKIGF